MKNRIRHHFDRIGPYPLLLLLAGAMLIFGSLTGWVVTGVASIPGFTGNGVITIICGVLILGIVMLLTVGERKRLLGYSLAGYVVAFAALMVAVYCLLAIARNTSGIGVTTIGAGLYITLTGAALAVIGSLGGIASVVQSRTDHPQGLSLPGRFMMLTLTLLVAVTVLVAYVSVGR